MNEKFKEQMKSSEAKIKASGLKPLSPDAIKKVSGGGRWSGFVAWSKRW